MILPVGNISVSFKMFSQESQQVGSAILLNENEQT